MRRGTTIFKQLIFNVVIPTLFALLVLAVINFQRTSRILNNASAEKNQLLSSEITKILRFQDVALKIIEEELNNRLKNYSDELINNYLLNTDNAENLDLTAIAVKMGMDTLNEDIYIIRRDGVVINTTFGQDYNTNLFELGGRFENYLLDIFRKGEYVSDLFAVEAKTKRPKKYCYQPTIDRKYIVELGAYSRKADEILQIMEETKNEIKTESKGIIDVELFLMADEPFSMNPDAQIFEGHNGILLRSFEARDTIVIERVGKSWYQYQYIYMERSESNLYKGSVIRIISDVSEQKALFRDEAIRFILIFGITILVVAYLIYRKTRVITMPIKKLVENVDRITGGDLRERAEVSGNNEITKLSEKFNMMIAQLESYYYELEEKVKERTLKIEKQKEEIEDQKKHIMDSIHYARRIQNAILPSFNNINQHLEKYFILYLPKDIVSGDFYWVHEADGLLMVAAVDCTGHGVPGAFMSIVGFNQLNHAVTVMKARTAGDILNELNAGVITTLNENTKEGSIKDGMDMSLCVLDIKNKKAQFAGANNPLIIIRDNKLIKHRGDRFPIGAFIAGLNQSFRNNEIDLRDGDCLYLFSDGYADQFGGTDNKKFMQKRFENLLMEIHEMTPEAQRDKLLSTLVDWRGANDQIDDVLVIGIMI